MQRKKIKTPINPCGALNSAPRHKLALKEKRPKTKY